MKNNKIAIAVMVVFAGASAAMAAEGTLSGLSSAGEKISSVDMDKNFNKAGEILDGFFTGSTAKRNSEPTEAVRGSATLSAEAGMARNVYGQTAKDLYTAAPAKKAKLASAVKQLPGAAARKDLAGQTKGWGDDFNTVVDYVGNVGGHAVDTIVDAGDIAINGVSITVDSNDNITGSNVTDMVGHAVDTYNAINCTD